MTEFTAKNPEWERRLRAGFDGMSMMKTLDARIDALAPGHCTISSSIPPGALQHAGHGHAGLTFSIADTAAGLAAMSLMDAAHDVVSAELKINLLAPARGDRLVAEGRVLRPGRRLFTVIADVFAETGGARSQIAIVTGTMVPVTSRTTS